MVHQTYTCGLFQQDLYFGNTFNYIHYVFEMKLRIVYVHKILVPDRSKKDQVLVSMMVDLYRE